MGVLKRFIIVVIAKCEMIVRRGPNFASFASLDTAPLGQTRRALMVNTPSNNCVFFEGDSVLKFSSLNLVLFARFPFYRGSDRQKMKSTITSSKLLWVCWKHLG